MKYLLFTLILLFANQVFSQNFVSPVNFIATEENKQSVISFIQKQVKDDYSKIGMDDPTTLRLMEQENLKAFKELTAASNTTLLKSVIKKYCDIGMCNYTTILLLYKQQEKDDKKSLEW